MLQNPNTQYKTYGTGAPGSLPMPPTPMKLNTIPTSSDVGFPLGQLGVYNGVVYCYAGQAAGQANWVILGSSSEGFLETLTAGGVAVSPDGLRNIDIDVGTGLTATGDADAHSITISLDSSPIHATVTTTDDTPATLISLSLGAAAGVYTFDVRISAFDAAEPAGAGFNIYGTVRTDGSAATVCGSPDLVFNAEEALDAVSAEMIAVGNAMVVQVTGLAATTIVWVADSVQTTTVGA